MSPQASLAQVILRDQFARPLRTVAGFAIGMTATDMMLHAAAVLLDADSLALIASTTVELSQGSDPGSDHEVAALLAALAELPQTPDLAFIGGHGIAHPQRLGLAARFGIASGLPSIGVADEILFGESHTNLHDMRGAFTPLRDGREQIGWILRSKPGCAPLVVSPGHRVALASAPGLVMRYITSDRLPETMRLAEQLASRGDHGTSASS